MRLINLRKAMTDKNSDDQDNDHKENDWKEEITVAGNELLDKIKLLVSEGNVRRLIIRKPDGEILIEVPLATGVAVSSVITLMAPVLAAIGAMTALVKNFKVEVIRESQDNGKDSDESDKDSDKK
jgi:Domain of unknown function (DUF4342)